MADNSSVWTFEQLGGPKKTLKLEDHAAPHGRERRKPVAEPSVELREDTVRYSGNPSPTRHIFGTKEAPITIEGRLSDSYAGAAFAKRKRREIESFFRDAQQCKVQWDDLVSVIGIMDKVKFGIESGGSITYKIDVLVDKDMLNDNLGLYSNTSVGRAPGAQSLMADINVALLGLDDLKNVPGMRGSFFDSISSLISSVASVTSAMNSIVGQIDSFVNAPFQVANQLRAALDQFRTAVTALRRAYDETETNVALERQNADTWQRFWDVKAAWAVSSLEAIGLALEMERALAIAQQGNILAIYTANQGDTWDQISRIAFNGSADRAEDIRKANGVEPGAAPVPGTQYMVPV